jgi:hypothetical protein
VRVIRIRYGERVWLAVRKRWCGGLKMGEEIEADRMDVLGTGWKV